MESKRRRLQRSRLYRSSLRSLEKMTSDSARHDSSDSDDPQDEQFGLAQAVSLEDREDIDFNSNVLLTANQNDTDSDSDNWELINDENEIVVWSDSEDEGQHIDKDNFKSDLIAWINKHQIKHNAVDDLLKLLKTNGLEDLPVTARTLLKTSKNVETSSKSSMEYIHFSLRDKLHKCLLGYSDTVLTGLKAVEISLNIDGLPIFKSTQSSVWPVLCALHVPGQRLTVFPITLTYGSSKPTSLDFLDDAITDVKNLLEHGLEYAGTVIDVKLSCVVCDAPARAFVKTQNSIQVIMVCDRCTQKGIWLKRNTYQKVDVELRTDASFRTQSQEEHHKGYTPLCELPIDMIKSFPLDYMHMTCLGVMKRLLLIWLRGKKETEYQLCKQQRLVKNW